MTLDPQARAVVEQLASAAMPDLSVVEPALIRRLTAASLAFGRREPVARVEERRIPGPAGEILVRLYAPGVAGPHPALLYFHGGGFVYCGLDTHDATCRGLSNAIGCAVVSVDYRLAPENKFPAAAEDCFAALRWVAEAGAALGLDPERLGVAGDSAGGNLAAVTALMARDRGGPSLRHQLLIYPMLDARLETASLRENAEGLLLTAKMVRAFWGHYLRSDNDVEHPYASPLRAPRLEGLPPACVITAEFDPLRDEGEAYAARLREAGVPVRARRYDGMIHGFFSMGHAIDRARDAVAEASAAVGAALGVRDAG